MYSLCSLKITILENKALVIILKGFWCAGWGCTWDMNLCPLQCLVRISLCKKNSHGLSRFHKLVNIQTKRSEGIFLDSWSCLYFTEILSGRQHLFLKIRNCLCSLTPCSVLVFQISRFLCCLCVPKLHAHLPKTPITSLCGKALVILDKGNNSAVLSETGGKVLCFACVLFAVPWLTYRNVHCTWWLPRLTAFRF